MESMITWISTNKNWLFEGIGVTAIVGIAAFFRNFFKKKNTESAISNTISGNNNIQAGGNVSIVNESEKKRIVRPKIVIDLFYKGSGSGPYSSFEKRFSWDYELIIRNNSSVAIYDIKLNIENGTFSYLEELNANEPLQSNSKISLRCNVQEIYPMGENVYPNAYIKYPKSIENVIILSNFTDEQGENYSNRFSLLNGQPINE